MASVSSGGMPFAYRPAYTTSYNSAHQWGEYGSGRPGPGISPELYYRQIREGQAAAGGVPGATSAMQARGAGTAGGGTGMLGASRQSPYGMGGGYGGGLAGDYQRAYDEARRANEARYEEIKGGYQGRYDEAMGLLEGQGEQERADLQRQYDQAAGRQGAYLRGRGLGGTTLAPTMAQGLESQRAQSMNRLNEQLRREQLGYMTGLSADKLGFMERRQDEYPDYQQLQQLSYMQGQAGGLGGTGSGYIVGGTPYHAGMYKSAW
jgi:hypothetical protein